MVYSMNIFEHIDRKTGYTAQELADIADSTLKEMETALMDQYQKGKIGMESANGYKFYFINEGTEIQSNN